MKVPYFDLSRSHQKFAAEAQAAFDRILKSGAYILGPALKQLEEIGRASCRERVLRLV